MPVIETTKENFTDLTKTGLVLIDFNADWCGPCQMLKPVIEELASDLETASEETKVLSVNIDDSPELADQFGVSGIPCLVLLKDGKEVNRSIGVILKKKIEKMLKKA